MIDSQARKRLQVAAGDQFLRQQPGHDRLAGAGIVGQQEPQRLPRQHRLVHRGDLMRQRLHQRGVHRQRGVEQVREVDAQRLGHQPKQFPVAVEAPRPPLLDNLQARFVVAVEDLAAQLAAGPPVGELQRVGPEPARAHHRHQNIRQDAAYGGGGLQVFQLHAGDDRRLSSFFAIVDDTSIVADCLLPLVEERVVLEAEYLT